MSFYVGANRLSAFAIQEYAWLSLPEYLDWLTAAETVEFADPLARVRVLNHFQTITRVAPYSIPPYLLLPNDVRFTATEAFVYLNNLVVADTLPDLFIALNYNEALDAPPYAVALAEYANAVAALRANLSTPPIINCVVDRLTFETSFALVWTAPALP